MLRLPSLAYLSRRSPAEGRTILDDIEGRLELDLENVRIGDPGPQRSRDFALVQQRLGRLRGRRAQAGL